MWLTGSFPSHYFLIDSHVCVRSNVMFPHHHQGNSLTFHCGTPLRDILISTTNCLSVSLQCLNTCGWFKSPRTPIKSGSVWGGGAVVPAGGPSVRAAAGAGVGRWVWLVRGAACPGKYLSLPGKLPSLLLPVCQGKLERPILHSLAGGCSIPAAFENNHICFCLAAWCMLRHWRRRRCALWYFDHLFKPNIQHSLSSGKMFGKCDLCRLLPSMCAKYAFIFSRNFD